MPISLSAEQKLKLQDELSARITRLRDRRSWIDDRYIRNHGAWQGTKMRSFYRSDTFNHFIPALRRAVERNVIRGAQMIVPSSQFFEVYPVGETTTPEDDERGDRAESVVQYLLYIFRKRIRPYSLAKQLLRSFYLFGRAIAKPGVRIEQEGQFEMVWPSVRVVDARSFYIFPENVGDIEQATMLVEDMYMTWESYQAAVEAGGADEVKREDIMAPRWPRYMLEQLSNVGMTPPSDLSSSGSEAKDTDTSGPRKVPPQDFLFISEVWLRSRHSWWFVWLLHNVTDGPKIVRVSSEVSQRPKYRVAMNREMPSEQYTPTMADDIEPLQVLLNDQMNLTMEGQAIAAAPPVAIDINAIGRFRPKYQPRAIWYTKTDGVKWMQPADTTAAGYKSMTFTFGMVDSFSGSNSLVEGQPTRNLPRAGFAVSSLLNLSLADIKDAAATIEDDIFTPLLHDIYRITVDFVPDSQVFKIPGTEKLKPQSITPRDIAGEFDLVWVGSLQSQDYQVRAQRLLSLVETLGGIPTLPQELAAQGKKINWVAIAKRLWREGLGERGADSIIADMTEEERVQFVMQQIAASLAQAQGGARGGGSPGPNAQAPITAEDVAADVADESDL